MMQTIEKTKKIILRTFLGTLAFMLAFTSMQLNGVTLFSANTVHADTSRDVLNEQKTPETVQNEPNNAVSKPEQKSGNKTTFTEQEKTVNTKEEVTQEQEVTKTIEDLVAAGYSENKDLRTLNSKTYELGNTAETIIYLSNVHYEENGEMKAYDSTLEKVKNNGTSKSYSLNSVNDNYTLKQSDVEIVIPETINTENPIQVGEDTDKISVSMPDYTLKNPNITDNVATYEVNDHVEVTVAAIDTAVKTIQKFEHALPEELKYQYMVPTGYELRLTEDNQAVSIYEIATDTVVDYLALPSIYDENGNLHKQEAMTLSLEHTSDNNYVVVMPLAFPTTPLPYPIYVDQTTVTIGGYTKGPDNEGVMVYGMNVIDGNTTYGPHTHSYNDFFMLGYVMDTMYYPAGSYQGVANLANTDIKTLIGDNREIVDASFNLFEFTASSSIFADAPININMSLIEKDYPGRPSGVTWNSWHDSSPQYSVIDTQSVSKHHNNFANFNIKTAVEAWYYSANDVDYGLHLAAERQGDGLLFLNHYVGNAFLNPAIWGGIAEDGRPYVTITHKNLEPIPDDYDLNDTTLNLRPFTSYDREGVLKFQTLGFDGIATPNAQVDVEVYNVKTGATIFTETTGAPNGLRTYPYYETPLYPEIPQSQKYYGRDSNWQASARLSTDNLSKDTEYGVRVRAQRLDDSGNIIETGDWVEGDKFQIYKSSGFDRVPRIMNFYGLSDRQIFMYDNHMQDELVFEGNEVFLRNPTKNQSQPYVPQDLSEEDKKIIDFSLIGRGKHCEFGYEPINLNTGNFYYTNEDTSWFDYETMNTLTRSYNSLAGGTESIFGRNWAFEWDKQLTFLKSGSAVFDDGSGRKIVFKKQTDGTYKAPTGEQITLTKETVGQKDYTEDSDYYDKVEEDPITTTIQIPLYEFVIKTKEEQTYRFTSDGYLKEATLDQYGHQMQFEYDSKKFLKKITTSSNKVFSFNYNSDGYVSAIKLPDNNTLGYTYDTKGNLVSFTDASGYTLTYEYLDSNNPYLMTSYLDRENNDAIIHNTFDNTGRVIKQLDAKGDTVTFTYHTDHTEITSFDGSKEYVYFDSQKRTTKSIAKDGTETLYTYDSNNNVATRDDGQHSASNYTYDTKGNILTETRIDGKVKSYSYDSNNNPISVTNFDGTVTNFTYDAKKNLTAAIYSDGTSLNYEYNNHGQKTKETDQTGNVITYSYDAKGNLTATTDYFGTKTKTYDNLSMVTSETDALGNTTEYIRNERGELIEQRSPNGTKTFQYDADGQKIYETDAREFAKTYKYDAWSRVIEETDSYGTKKSTYDAFGNLLTSTDELGNVTTYVYDAANRLIKTINPDSSFTESVYDAKGNLVESIDVLGNSTTYEYDSLGRKIKEVDAKGRITTYEYDLLGNLLKTTYPDGLSESNTYNALNQMTSSTDKKGNVTTYIYDANGNNIETNINDEKITKTNFGIANTETSTIDELGNTTTKQYNAVKLADTVTMKNGLVQQYVYDGEYNIIQVIDNAGTVTTKVYDANRNVTAETDELGNTTTYTYTSRNQLATTTYPDGGITQNVYDAKGQTIKTVDQLGYETTTVFDNMGRSIQTTDANGNTTQSVYNDKGQLIESIDAFGQKTETAYDSYGLKTTSTDVTGKVTTYTYDDQDRVILQKDSYGGETHTTYNQYGETIETRNEQGHITKTEYDAYGQQIKTVDMRGNVQETVYDNLGRVIETTDNQGNITKTTYNEIGQTATEIVTSDNGTVIIESFYNAQGLLDRTVKNGDVTTYTYDAKGQITSITLPNGGTTTYTYTFDGKEATVTDANGGVTTSVYDKKGQLIKTIDALGNTTQKVFDGNGNVLEEIDPLGQSNKAEYDALNRSIKQIDKNGNTTSTTYDAANQPLIITLPNNTTREYTYDDEGRTIATKNVPCDTCSGTQGNSQKISYDEFDRKIIVRFENGYEEYYEYTQFNDIAKITNNLHETIEANVYDTYGRLTEKTDAHGNKTLYEYNNKDQIIKTIAANGNMITYSYNEFDKISEMKDIRGNITEYKYDALGNMLAMKLPGEKEFIYEYDKNSNLVSEVNTLGNTTSYQYDLNNRVITTTNALGYTTDVTYTANGKIANQTDARGNTVSYQYDAIGNKTVAIDEIGERTEYAYDEMSRLSLVKNRNGAVTSYGYDYFNNHTYTLDARGYMTTFKYDNMNNLTKVNNADASKERFTYDTKGNKLTEQSIDRRTITYQYDALNNQIYKKFDDEEYVYVYDEMNQIVEMLDSKTRATFVYNTFGDMLSYTDINGNAVSYGYDSLGRRTSITYPNEKEVFYTYDKNDQLIEVNDEGKLTTYEYDAIGRLTKTYLPNNIQTASTYDENGNTTRLLTTQPDETGIAHLIITDLKYEYDERNLITKETNNIEGMITEKTYKYDAEEQLIQSIHKTDDDEKVFIYEYDVNGNKTLAKEVIDGKVTNRQFSFDKSNKLTEESGEFEVAYTYNKSGNVIEKNHKTTGLIEKFSYNAEGQLIQVENNHGKVITYMYDGFGNRIQKVETTSLQDNNFETLTNIATDDNTFNEEYDVEFAKQITKEKLTDLKTTIEEFSTTYDQMCPLVTNEGDREDSQIVLNYVNDINAAYTEVLQVQSQNYEPLYTYTYGMQRISNDKENDTLLYYQYDARGSVIGQQKEDSSALHLKISYNDYGKPNRNLNNEYGYNAEAHDYNGTQYLRARYYNTDTGRFDQQDSYRGEQNNPVSQNRYTYVWNSPNQYIDKSGKSASRASNESIHAFNTLVDIEKSQNKGFSEKCLQWRVALSVADDPFMQFQGGLRGMAYFHAVDVKNFFLYQHGVPRCDVDPPYETPNWADEHNETHHGDNETAAEARRRADEERQRKEAEVNAIKEELENAGINLSGFDFSSMSLDERLQLLRHIKKICEDYGLNTEHWDASAAQDIIDTLIPENGSDPYNGGFINASTIFSVEHIRIQVPDYIIEQQSKNTRSLFNSNLTTLDGLSETLGKVDWSNVINDIQKILSLLLALVVDYGFMVSGSMMGTGIIYILLTVMTAPRDDVLTEKEWESLDEYRQELANQVLSLVTIDLLRKVVNEGFWGKGTFLNSKVNFIIHFAKHRKDRYIQMETDPLGYYVLSIAAYLGAIGNFPDWPRVGTTSLGGSKYKSITTKRYVIIEIEGKEKIASFGGN